MEVRRYRVITVLADIVILAVSFLILVWIRPASLKSVLPSHTIFFVWLALMWIIISLMNGKMHRRKIVSYSSLLSRVLTSNIIAISITALIMYTLRDYAYSRTVVLGTAILATFFELITGGAFISYKKAKLQDSSEYDKFRSERMPSEYELVQQVNGSSGIMEQESPGDITGAMLGMAPGSPNEHTAVLSATSGADITGLSYESYDSIINLEKINKIKKLDEFLDALNAKLKTNGCFICCVETKDQRKKRILKKYFPGINYIVYTVDFFVKRVFPKLRITKKLYMFLTNGDYAVISRAEALGRLCRSGFKIRQESFVGNLLCIEAIKISEPFPGNGSTYGPLIALPRVGKEGKIIKVYKLRTMHPYSEYIQDYIYEMHKLQNGGKFRNDFRITSWGSFCRKVWLDELPMVINFMKGDMKLFGVRPLSRHYFELYREEVKARRIRYKPGLIPPFYADMPGDLDAIQDSEIRYLDAYDRYPVFTDVRYLFKSGWNILFRRARSN
jgi:lipopolysaccharide/colanic/teichoic acid biosynthesis glycosyltransferase